MLLWAEKCSMYACGSLLVTVTSACWTGDEGNTRAVGYCTSASVGREEVIPSCTDCILTIPPESMYSYSYCNQTQTVSKRQQSLRLDDLS
jgi:hypothetical protein